MQALNFVIEKLVKSSGTKAVRAFQAERSAWS